jgi:hypothetical protein
MIPEPALESTGEAIFKIIMTFVKERDGKKKQKQIVSLNLLLSKGFRLVRILEFGSMPNFGG